MKRIVLTAALIAAIGAMTETPAQICKNAKSSHDNNGTEDWHRPHKSWRHRHGFRVETNYDEVSTMLTVSFPSNSHGGTVEVYRDGAKVAGITANGGTTFSCVLREYGEGDYTVIVYNGNTVIDNKNYTVK